MADAKISELGSIAAADVASGDWIPVVDVSAAGAVDPLFPGRGAGGTTKRLDALPLLSAGPLTFLSARGITSDAAGAIGYGATAPSGTDRTAAIQAVIDAMPAGGVLVWDVAVGLSAPILLPSNFTLWAPSPAHGAIKRAAANSPMFRNKGITTDATTSKQKTFGKVNPVPGGNAAYRVLDPVNFLNDRSITVRGGTWNGNKAQQTGYPFTATYGFLSVFQFWGVEDVLLQDMLVLRPHSALPIHFCNWHRVTIDRVVFDGSPLSSVLGGVNSMAAFQLNGPGRMCRGYGTVAHADDDMWAFNADDSTPAAIEGGYAGGAAVCTPGVNWVQSGDITDVRVIGHRIDDGVEGTTSSGGVRLFSSYHRIDDVIFDGMTGTVNKYFCIMGPITVAGMMQVAGVGNMGRVEFRNISVDLVSPHFGGSGSVGNGVFDIQGSAELIRIAGRIRGKVPTGGAPDVSVLNSPFGASVVENLVLEGDYHDPSSSSGVAAPQVRVATTVNRLMVRTRSSRNSAQAASASPVLRTATGAAIDLFEFHGAADRITNLVDHAAGTLTTVMASGSHRNAGGGSPLAVASGLTVTNTKYSNLLFKSTLTFKGGAGAVTNDNTYVEATASAYLNQSTFTGAGSTNLDVYTPEVGAAWTLHGAMASSKPVVSGGVCTIPSIANGQEGYMVCDAGVGNGNMNILGLSGQTSTTGIVLVFYFADTNNFGQAVFDLSANTISFYRVQGGSATFIPGGGYTLPAGSHDFGLAIGPTNLTVFVDGVTRASTALSNFSALNANTKAGLKIYGGGGASAAIALSEYRFSAL